MATQLSPEGAAASTTANGRATHPRTITSLPATIDWLRRERLLLETNAEVNPDLELTGIQKALDGSYPIVFSNVKGYPHVRALTNLFANYDIIEKMFGWSGPTERTRELAYALTHPIAPEEMSQ